MDPWSSPWNDDGGPVSAGTQLDHTAAAITSTLASTSLSADAADPWGAGPSNEPETSGHGPRGLTASPPKPSLQKLPSVLFASSAPWSGDAAEVLPSPPAITKTLSDSAPTTPTNGSPADGFPASSIEADPWSSTPQHIDESKTLGSESALGPRPPSPLTGSQALRGGWSNENDGWSGSSDLPSHPSASGHGFGGAVTSWSARQDLSVSGALAEPDDAADGLEGDVWGAEAAARAQHGTELTMDEMDQLKVDARKMVTSNDADRTAGAFRTDPAGEEGWGGLFGAEGSKTNVLRDLQQQPGDDGAEGEASVSNSSVKLSSTTAQTREAVRQTEGKGANLTALEGSSLWKRFSKAAPKPESDSSGMKPQEQGKRAADGGQKESTDQDRSKAAASGPGWYQNPSKEARPTSTGGLFASLFRGRQASATSSQSRKASAANSSPRPSFDQSPVLPQSTTLPTPLQRPSSITGGPAALSNGPATIFTDDPAGHDLMQIDQDTAAAATESREEARPSLLSRWRKAQIFSGGAANSESRSGGHNGELSKDDLDWLDKAPSKGGAYTDEGDTSYDDSFDDFNIGSRDVLHNSRPKWQAGNLIDGNDEDADDNDPFNALVGTGTGRASSYAAAHPPRLASGAASDWSEFESIAPSQSARADRGTGFGIASQQNGSSTTRLPKIQTTIVPERRAPPSGGTPPAVMARLPPPPSSKRVSLPPPPHAHKATSPLTRQAAAPANDDLLFSDFVAPAPAKMPAQPADSQRPLAAAKAAQPLSKGSDLTADDLSFFDSL